MLLVSCFLKFVLFQSSLYISSRSKVEQAYQNILVQELQVRLYFKN